MKKNVFIGPNLLIFFYIVKLCVKLLYIFQNKKIQENDILIRNN